MLAPLHRIILFVHDIETCARFYSDVFGFPRITSDPPDTGWVELETGGCRLALHKTGTASADGAGAARPHKIVFFTPDVGAARETLLARGARMGKLQQFDHLTLCDGRDPEGNVFQISNRT